MVHHTTIGPLNIWVSERHTIPLRPINVVIGESYTQHLQETGALLHLATTHHLQDTIVLQDQAEHQPPRLSQTSARSNPPAVEELGDDAPLITSPAAEEQKEPTPALPPPSTREVQTADSHDTASRDEGSAPEHQPAIIKIPSTAPPQEEQKAAGSPTVGDNAIPEETHHDTVAEKISDSPPEDETEASVASLKTGVGARAVDSNTRAEPSPSRNNTPAVEHTPVPGSPADSQKGKKGAAASYFDKSNDFNDMDRGRSASRKEADGTPLANVPDAVEDKTVTTATGGHDTQAAGPADPEKIDEQPDHDAKPELDAPGPVDQRSRDGSVSGSPARTIGEFSDPLQEVAASPDAVNADGQSPSVATVHDETPEKTTENVLQALSPTGNPKREAGPPSGHLEEPESENEAFGGARPGRVSISTTEAENVYARRFSAADSVSSRSPMEEDSKAAGPTKPDSGHPIGHTVTRNGSQGPQPALPVAGASLLDQTPSTQAPAT